MRKSEAVGDYLHSLVPEGSSSETLAFTIDQVRAAQKLSESQLPEPALWIVKMVQAAVASGSTGVDIVLGRNRVEVEFDTQLECTAKSLFEMIVSGVLPTDPALLHLLTGIRTAFASPGSSFSLQIKGPNGRELVALAEGESYHFSDDEKSDITKLNFVIIRSYRLLGLKKSLHLPVKRLFQGTAAEHTEIVNRCWPSPIPVRIDGRAIQTGYDSPLMHGGKNRFATAQARKAQWLIPRVNLFMKFWEAEEDKPTLPPPNLNQKYVEATVDDVVHRVRRPVYEDETFMIKGSPPDRIGGIQVNPLGQGRRSYLFFIHDGVVVQKAPMNFIDPYHRVLGQKIRKATGGGDCFLQPVEFKELDLSQFSVRDAEARRRTIMERILAEWLPDAELFTKVVKHFVLVPASRNRSKLAVGISSAAAIPVALSFGASGLGIYLLYQGFFGAVQGGFAFLVNQATLRTSLQTTRKILENHNLDEIEQDPIE